MAKLCLPAETADSGERSELTVCRTSGGRGALYCEETCKKRAARAGRVQLTAEPKITGTTPQLNRELQTRKPAGNGIGLPTGGSPCEAPVAGLATNPGRCLRWSRQSRGVEAAKSPRMEGLPTLVTRSGFKPGGGKWQELQSQFLGMARA
jgi:hypothetical protein